MNSYKQKIQSSIWALSASVALVAWATSASYGATVQSTTKYGMLKGTHVTYMEINESTLTESPAVADADTGGFENLDEDVLIKTALAVTDVSDPSTLYGTPEISGNTLFFKNPTFAAQAGILDPQTGTIVTSDLLDGRLNFGLQADANMYVNHLTVEEFGAISLTSPAGTANSATLVRIESPAFIHVFDVMLDNGEIYTLPKATGERLIAEIVLNPDESSSAGGYHSADPDIGSYWEGEIKFDIQQQLEDNGVFGPAGRTIVGATRLDYVMNNILTAHAHDGISTAFVDKKGITVLPEMTPMNAPEPNAALLMLPCLLALAAQTRRKR